MEKEEPPAGFPEQTEDWQAVEAMLLRQVRAELGDGLRRRLESMDVVQDVMTELVRTREAALEATISDFRGWLRGVLRNRIRNLANFHTSARRDMDRETLVEEGPGVAANTPAPDEEAVRRADYAQLVQSLGQLKPDDRALILLRNFEQLSWQEIAVSTGRRSADAARVAFSRAMVRFTASFVEAHQ